MSQLQKKISRIQRRETASIGFGHVNREQPRAMLLAVLARDGSAAKAALGAGADAVIVRAADAAAAARIIEPLTADKAIAGAWLDRLDNAGAEALRKAGCDFVISTLEGTESAAVDTEKMGQIVVAAEGIEDTTLRALGPLGLDGLFVERPTGAMTLAAQLGLVRLASFASAQLVVTADASASVSDLRVLRDSGAVAVAAAEGTTPEQVKALVELLKAVPAPRKGNKGGEGRDIALVPSMAAHGHDEEDDDDDDDGE
ncbi:MAG: hypothetical protein ACRDG3_12385 [Tepidiformaceae bacterium]